MSLAIFDLDNTLIAGDSDHLWGEFLIEKNKVDAHKFKQANDQFYADYQASNLDIQAYLSFALQPLTQFTNEELEALHAEFMETKINPIMLPKALELIKKHQSRGNTLLIITATNRFVTQPIANKLGITNLLASEPEIIEGKYTGNAIGTPCYQHGKVERLHEWLSQTNHSLVGSFFYSDSINDLPLLSLVDNPVVVDGDRKLQAWAASKSTPSISLR